VVGVFRKARGVELRSHEQELVSFGVRLPLVAIALPVTIHAVHHEDDFRRGKKPRRAVGPYGHGTIRPVDVDVPEARCALGDLDPLCGTEKTRKKEERKQPGGSLHRPSRATETVHLVL
jgi:hypothetical protein